MKFGNSRRLHRLDIQIGTTNRVADIRKMIGAAKKRLRNVVARLRLINDHARTLAAIGGFRIDRSERFWKISLAAVIDLGRLHELRGGDMLERLWHGRRQASLRPLDHRDMPALLTGTLDYSKATTWEGGVAMDLFSILAETSNFASLRYQLRPSRKMPNNSVFDALEQLAGDARLGRGVR